MFQQSLHLVKQDCESSHAKAFEESFQEFCANGGVSRKKKQPTKLLYETIKICHSLWIEQKEVDDSVTVMNLNNDSAGFHLQKNNGAIVEKVEILTYHEDSNEDEDPYGKRNV